MVDYCFIDLNFLANFDQVNNLLTDCKLVQTCLSLLVRQIIPLS